MNGVTSAQLRTTCGGAPGNDHPANRRRAFAHRWVGDDVRFARRGGEVSPPFPEVHERLRDGDPLDDPCFPLVWPRQHTETGHTDA